MISSLNSICVATYMEFRQLNSICCALMSRNANHCVMWSFYPGTRCLRRGPQDHRFKLGQRVHFSKFRSNFFDQPPLIYSLLFASGLWPCFAVLAVQSEFGLKKPVQTDPQRSMMMVFIKAYGALSHMLRGKWSLPCWWTSLWGCCRRTAFRQDEKT